MKPLLLILVGGGEVLVVVIRLSLGLGVRGTWVAFGLLKTRWLSFLVSRGVKMSVEDDAEAGESTSMLKWSM
jgi:hypothetical protein